MRRFGLAVLGVALAAAAGCGDLYPVEGTVKVDGKPVEKGTLVFFCPVGDTRVAEALVQDGGTFTLKTSNQVGVMRGEYKVTITNSVNSITAPWQAEPNNFNDPAWAAYAKKLEDLQKRPPAPGQLPHHYAHVTTTTLTFKVPDDGRRADFDIPSGVTAGKK